MVKEYSKIYDLLCERRDSTKDIAERNILEVLLSKDLRADRTNQRFWETYESYLRDFNKKGNSWFKKAIKPLMK